MIPSSMITKLRVLVNDLEETDYTDCRLEQVLAVAADFVQQDLGINTYTVDIEGQDISPNPQISNDIGFINLVVLKAGCIIDQGTYRTQAALAGLTASAGPASLTIGNANIAAYKDILNMGSCALYKEMLIDYKLHSNQGICHAILSPFISSDFDPQSLNTLSYEQNNFR